MIIAGELLKDMRRNELSQAPKSPSDSTTTRSPTRRLSTRPDAYAGKVALVSGGAGGIGRAIAWLLARLGAHVIVAGRSEAKLDALVEAMTKRGLDRSRQVVDIREPEQVGALFDQVWSARGRARSSRQ